MVITSPNQDWVLEHPIERNVIRTYANGLWGYHEYAQWPQPLTPNMYHVACIPRPRTVDALPPIVWVTLQRESDWAPSREAALHAVGFLKEHIRDALSFAASQAIDRFDSFVGRPDHLRSYGQEIRLLLRKCLDTMRRLPTPASVAIALGAHVQRLSLELDGGDYLCLVLSILGAFVHDEHTALRCAKAGLPVWLVQPLTRNIKVWRVVAAEKPPYMCAESSNPPLEYHPEEVAGVVNTSESWLSRMVFAISRQLCSASLPTLTDSHAMISKNITMAEAPPPTRAERPVTYKKTRREFTESPFYRLPAAWKQALRAVGSLPQPVESVVYFYPPPFLLDTVSSETPEPVHQYLHSLVRIRAFCRWQLLDLTVSGRPLTIPSQSGARRCGETIMCRRPLRWRAWRAGSTAPTKKFATKSSIARLCANSAALTSYDASQVHKLAGLAVSSETAARCQLAHEITFRCKVMALDTLMVPRHGWPVMHRWAREAQVSAIWGPPASLLTVIPEVPADIARPWWIQRLAANWQNGEARLRAFVELMSKWAGLPAPLLATLQLSPWNDEQYEWVQIEAVDFYVRTFVSKYHRLPVPPMDYPVASSLTDFPDMHDT
ncbi:hypothetical protein C8T65DRAFT_711463 [Cerioporus squamosus]|nr:hypothetical protein C8T65DRAFT_711463 [Cerioporus squamosus]